MTMTLNKTDLDAQESAQRLVDFIQVITPNRPLLVQALERTIRALLAEETRQRIVERLSTFSPEQIHEADAATQEIERKGL